MVAVGPDRALHGPGSVLLQKSGPQDPRARMPELVAILRSDPDERKRTAAADELREYDSKSYPEIVPALVEAAGKDAKYGVRSEALSSLSRIRPVSQAAGQALEQAAANDPHWPNRMHAKSSLVRYHWAGYTSSGQDASAKGANEPTKEAPKGNLPPVTTIPSPQAGMQPPPQNPYAGNSPYPISPNQRPNPTPAVTTSRPNVPNNPPISYPGYAQPMPSTAETPPMMAPNQGMVAPHNVIMVPNNPAVPVIVTAPPLVNSVPQQVVPVPMMPMHQPLNPLPTVETRQVPESGLQFKPAPPLSTVETSKVVETVPIPQATKEVPLIDLNAVLQPKVNNVTPPIVTAPPILETPPPIVNIPPIVDSPPPIVNVPQITPPGAIPLPPPSGITLPPAPEIPKF